MANINWGPTLPLNPSSIESVDAKPGVYRLSYQSAEGPLYVFFVGKSDVSLKEELQKLVNKTTDNVCIKTHLENLECYFKCSIIEDDKLRHDAERTLYDHFKPKCNLGTPEGDPIELNVT